jgi:hypothetical protein
MKIVAMKKPPVGVFLLLGTLLPNFDDRRK